MPRIKPGLPIYLALAVLAVSSSTCPRIAIAAAQDVAVTYQEWLEFTGLALLIQVDEMSVHPTVHTQKAVGQGGTRTKPSPRRYVLYLTSAMDRDSWTDFSESFSDRMGIELPHRLISKFADLLAVPISQVRIDIELDCAWLSYVADTSGGVQLDWSSPCAGPPLATKLLWRELLAGLRSQEETDYHVVEVFYGTDRGATGPSKASQGYGSSRGILTLGRCEVSVPRDHRIGLLEAPSIWDLEFKEDPERHVVLLSVEEQPRDRFVEALRKTVSRSKRKTAFVFIHGYKVTFEDAARRTAQMAYDLQFDGAPILYSWPSKGKLLGYAADEATIQWTVPHLTEFLSLVAAESGAETIHLIAHSLGNRALAEVLRRFVESQAPPRFSQIALVAPDIDAEVFKQDIAPRIVEAGERVTLYASSNDEALAASGKIHAAPRAGHVGESIVIVPGVDTIDVSDLDTSLMGHSYHAENRSVISDLFYLLRGLGTPETRFGMEKVRFGELAYWRFRPGQ